VSELESEWKDNDIHALIEKPFKSVTIMRFSAISNLSELEVITNIKLLHFDAVLVHDSVTKGGSRQQFSLIETAAAKELQSNLILVKPTNVFLDQIMQDEISTKIMSDIEALFRGTGHEVKHGRVTEQTSNPREKTIAVYLPQNPRPELVEAVNMMCSSLNRHVSYQQNTTGNTLQIVIGPP